MRVLLCTAADAAQKSGKFLSFQPVQAEIGERSILDGLNGLCVPEDT